MAKLSNRNTSPRALRVGLLLAWIAFIWIHSMMPGRASSAESGFIVDILKPHLVPDPLSVQGLILLVRKTAHFSEYALLGVLAMNAFAELPLWAPILCGAFTAAFDETIQLFVPERSGSIVDVGIDLAGFAVGICLVLLVRRISARRARI